MKIIRRDVTCLIRGRALVDGDVPCLRGRDLVDGVIVDGEDLDGAAVHLRVRQHLPAPSPCACAHRLYRTRPCIGREGMRMRMG